jgi:hypothetical protein
MFADLGLYRSCASGLRGRGGTAGVTAGIHTAGTGPARGSGGLRPSIWTVRATVTVFDDVTGDRDVGAEAGETCSAR